MKRFLGAALAAALFFLGLPAARAVSTSASSAVLMEASTGRVLWAQNADQPRLIASVTKLMTALVALESGRGLDEQVTILEEDTRTEGSALYLRPGESVKLETLLYGLLLNSGNDAALAVARFCGGSVEAFVGEMNRKAQALGMENTRFANPSGLNAEGHFSSARDLALLARACLDHETLARMVSTRSRCQNPSRSPLSDVSISHDADRTAVSHAAMIVYMSFLFISVVCIPLSHVFSAAASSVCQNHPLFDTVSWNPALLPRMRPKSIA